MSPSLRAEPQARAYAGERARRDSLAGPKGASGPAGQPLEPQIPQPLVLVVDDDPQQRLLMFEALDLAGIRVCEAAGGQEALDAFGEIEPDLVLLDVMMPGLNGFMVCQELRQRPNGHHVPILIVTGLEDLEAIEQAFQVGATDFITKPIRWPLLSNRVRYALRTSQAERDLRATKDALAESERHFRNLTENALDQILILDHRGHVTFVNASVASLTGLEPMALMNRPLADFICPEDRHGFNRFLRDLLSQPSGAGAIEFRISHRSEAWRYVEAKGRNLLGDVGVDGIFLAARDMTARYEAECCLIEAKSEAEQANKAKSLFLAKMSHELRTPLNPIVGFAELIMQSPDADPEKVSEYAEDIRNSGLHLLGIIDDVLEQARAETGKLQVQWEEIDIAEICRSAISLMADRPHESEVTLQTEIGADLPMFQADARLLKQILANLLSNALKFTPPGGHIRISATYDLMRDEHVLQVTDNGVGIPAAELPKVLLPFYQVSANYTADAGGTGLGLSLVKSFVEAHGGRLQLDSPQGRGTIAACRFPGPRRDVEERAARAIAHISAVAEN